MDFAGTNYAYLHPAEPGAHNYVTTQLTLDARGAGMTPAAKHFLSHREVNHRDLVDGGLRGGCDAVNASACRFGSTLALYSIEFCAQGPWRALRQEYVWW